ncbi:MAG TPA: TonB-dependent receptor [Steroidobacteraceae bacterium]|nr:TonB-dependent receptor [Steroidobacteraceae bacterium]
MSFDTRRARQLRAVISGLLGTAAFAATLPSYAQTLEVVTVTAQRRETDLQTTPVAISAYGGEALVENKIFTVNDLAASAPAFSLTALTPLDAELNIRGITNTRLDSPTADPSVGTFVDGVYMGRTGDLNYDFYDLERIEVIRGPQGVLLGKNVVGGALSVITAKPTFEPSGNVLVSYGNYNSMLVSGFANGGLSDSWAGRVSFQGRQHDGYAEDVLHHRDTDDLESYQARVQLLYGPDGSAFTGRLALDYNHDENNGLNTVAVAGGTRSCETSYLRTNCTRPWSNLRAYLGLTDPRKNVAQSIQYAGQPRIQQFMERDGFGAVLDLQFEATGFTFNSLTGFRDGEGQQVYDQTGAGPEALGWDPARWAQYIAFVNTTYGTRPATSNNGQFLFAQPVGEDADIQQFSQEFRFTSNNKDSRLDWIAGVYLKKDDITKVDRFIGENFLGTVLPGGNNPLSTLSGENRWVNDGKIENYAGFAQFGFKFTDAVKLSVGARYTHDKKEGNVSGFVVATGDRFSPNDPRPNVTIEGLCRTPTGGVVSPTPAQCLAPNQWIYSAGSGFQTDYSKSWSETTPQATLEWTVSDTLFLYTTVAKGFKGGGFDDTPANIAQAVTPFDPEKATNYEIGFKTDLLDRRMRLNADVFYMDYKDLQVTQTNAACLCNITDNAASAEIKGVEAEWQFAATERLRLSLAGSYVDATYKDFLESAINPSTGQRLDSSGNRLQRTPETQITGGVDFTMPVGQLGDALNFRVNYTWQSDMFWATDNIAKEDAYGLLDVRVALSPPGSPWAVALWGKNVTDELYRVNIISFFGEEVSQFAAPRTYGVDFSWKF